MQLIKKIVTTIITWEARLLLARRKPKVIAVTGSVGKTTTKDAVYAALEKDVHVRKSAKSFNSDIGVPLTILGLENAWNNPLRWAANIAIGLWRTIAPNDYPAWLVLEVGADRPGDIRRIAKWLRPDIAIITGVPEIPVHVEYFSSPDEVLREKRALAEYLKPGGKLVLNGDDPRMREIQAQFRGASLTYGMAENNDFFASHEEVLYGERRPTGVRFRLNRSGVSMPVSIFGALGRPRVYAALAALAVGEIVGVDLVFSANALSQWAPPPGRVRILRGLRGTTIIDDTYNSSPSAALAALDTLAELKTEGRKIAVLGDMLELGKYSKEAHRNVGERAAACADVLITLGFRSRAMAEAALDAGMPDTNIGQYEQNEAERAGKELLAGIREGDIILVKGSQGMRMEKTVYELMEDSAHASDLLVRWDPDWRVR